MGIFSFSRSIVSRPPSVRDQMPRPTVLTITSGASQKIFPVSQPESVSTIWVTSGNLPPKPANKSDILGTTYTIRNTTMLSEASSRNNGYASAPRIFRRSATERRI